MVIRPPVKLLEIGNPVVPTPDAIDGDTPAARECFDRMDGKVTQGVDATGQVRGDITLTWKPPAD
jgi:hypothetical protein